MRRVSSRQRIVSWDAFDAAAPELSSSSEDEDNMSGYLTASYDPSPSSRRSSLAAMGVVGTFGSRDDEDDGMFALDLEEDTSTAPRLAAASSSNNMMLAMQRSLLPTAAKASASAGTKRDRSGLAAESSGMKNSVSFSSLLASANATPANSAPPSAPATPKCPNRPVSFVEDGRSMTTVPAPASALGLGLPRFPTLGDPVRVEPDEDEGADVLRPEGDDSDDDYGHMPALSTVAAVLKNPAVRAAMDNNAEEAEEEDDSEPLGPEDEDDDDYGKLPVQLPVLLSVPSPKLSALAAPLQQALAVAASSSPRAGPRQPPAEDPSPLLPADEDKDDDDYGKPPVVSDATAPGEGRNKDNEPLAPEEDGEDGDDYGKTHTLAAAASAHPMGLVEPLDLNEDDGDDYGKMPAVSTPAATAPATQQQQPPAAGMPRNESELSLGLRYMTPLPSTADLKSLDTSSHCSSLHRALQLHAGVVGSPAKQVMRRQSGLLEAPRGLLVLTSLPDDPLLRVLSYLPPYDVRRASAACCSIRTAAVGEAGRHLWTGMMAERWPILGRISRADGGVEFVDGSGIGTAGLGGGDDVLARMRAVTARRKSEDNDDAGDGTRDPNLSVLLGMSALRSPSRVDPYYHAPTSHRSVEFRSFDLEPPRPDDLPPSLESSDTQSPTTQDPDDDEAEAEAADERRRAESRRWAQALLAEQGAVPVVQFTGRVGAGDRCVRSDAPLARPSVASSPGTSNGHNTAVGNQAGGDNGSGSLSVGAGHSLSSSPAERMMEFLRNHGICGADKDEPKEARPFVSPFVANSPSERGRKSESKQDSKPPAADGAASGGGKTVIVDLTPRLVSYFEVSILRRDAEREPPMEAPPAPRDMAAERAAQWLREGGFGPPRRELRGPRGPLAPRAAAEARGGGGGRRPLHPRAAVGPEAGAAGNHPGQHIPTVHFHHPMMPLPLPIPAPVPGAGLGRDLRLLPLPRNNQGLGIGLPPTQETAAAGTDCVAVGLSTRSFLSHRRMPGWDRHSYGYHGDDGGIFHSSGEMERTFGPTYGPGDTVGCGVDYLVGGIFFTLNGEFLGYAWTGLEGLKGGGASAGSSSSSSSGSDRDHGAAAEELYPTVGVDSTCPVVCNFGEREFAFDLGAFVREGEHGEAVRDALGGLVRGNGEKDTEESDHSGSSSVALKRMATV